MIFVSFSGIDGAGKSTQIKKLQARLAMAGVAVTLLTFWDDIAAFRTFREHMSLLLLKGDPGVGSADRPINRRDKNVSSWYLVLIRLIFCLFDVISLNWATRRARRSAADVVIFDRYIYDELANLPLERALMKNYARFVLSAARRPQVAYLLDAEPVEARLRKPEYPLEFLSKNRQRYLTLASMAPEITVVDALQPQDVERQVLQAIANHFPAQALQHLSPSGL